MASFGGFAFDMPKAEFTFSLINTRVLENATHHASLEIAFRPPLRASLCYFL
jgi:hypothetical protein